MKIQADLGLVDDNGKHRGQIHDLLSASALPQGETNPKLVKAAAEANALLDQVTPAMLTERGGKSPELLPAINELLKLPRFSPAAAPKESPKTQPKVAAETKPKAEK